MMSTLLISIVAIAAIDSINPNAIALQIYLLSTPKPVVRSLAFIFGDFIATWLAGLLLVFGMASAIAYIFNFLGEGIYLLQFILGIALILIGFNLDNTTSQHLKRPQSLKPIHTFMLGATMAFVEAPTAFPYLAALERMVHANLPFHQLLGVLTLYNIIFVFPLIGLLGIYLFFRNRAAALINRINYGIAKWFPKIMRVIFIVFGIVFIVDCIAYFLGRSFLWHR